MAARRTRATAVSTTAVSVAEARRIALAAQGFPRPATADHASEAGRGGGGHDAAPVRPNVYKGR